MLCSYKEAQSHLRLDSEDDKSLVEAYIKASSNIIKKRLKNDEEIIYINQMSEEKVVRPEIKIACLQLVAEFYRYREGDSPNKIDDRFGYGYLPYGVEALLMPYQKWEI